MIKRNLQKGFTLIEMVVAIALFIVVAMVAIVALLNIVDANKKAQGLKTAISNLNYTLESMTRELRVGTGYKCFSGSATPVAISDSLTDCPQGVSGSWTIAFKTQIRSTSNGTTCNLINVYHFTGKSIYKGEQTACNTSYSLYPLIYGSSYIGDPRATESFITFTHGSLKVVSQSDKQPYAKIHLVGYAGVKERLRSYFDMQTLVSQRLGD